MGPICWLGTGQCSLPQRIAHTTPPLPPPTSKFSDCRSPETLFHLGRCGFCQVRPLSVLSLQGGGGKKQLAVGLSSGTRNLLDGPSKGARPREPGLPLSPPVYALLPPLSGSPFCAFPALHLLLPLGPGSCAPLFPALPTPPSRAGSPGRGARRLGRSQRSAGAGLGLAELARIARPEGRTVPRAGRCRWPSAARRDPRGGRPGEPRPRADSAEPQ